MPKQVLVGKFLMHENDNPYIRFGKQKFARNASQWLIYDPWGNEIASTNEARKFKYYDAHATLQGDWRAVVQILRRSRRKKRVVPLYKGVDKKKECPICRTCQHMLYKCNVCEYRMCRGCVLRTQKNNLSCVVCKVGMMPWSGEM